MKIFFEGFEKSAINAKGIFRGLEKATEKAHLPIPKERVINYKEILKHTPSKEPAHVIDYAKLNSPKVEPAWKQNLSSLQKKRIQDAQIARKASIPKNQLAPVPYPQ
jgi:hypothetical protein